MLDQDKSKDPEELITCPYDVVHNVTRKRMAIHLEKCRKQHLELAREMKVCEYNVAHRIYAREYEFHKQECPDRDTFYNHKYKVGGEANPAVEALKQNTMKPLEIPCSETLWDDEANPQQNILNDINREAEGRDVLRNHMNEPPAVLKAMREEERRKKRERINEEERAAINQKNIFSSNAYRQSDPLKHGFSEDTDSSSMVSVTSSVPSGTTIRSESDTSFQSALTTTQQMMDSFQVVENKRRGRGGPRTPVLSLNSSQMGMGRGKKIQPQ